MHLILVRSKLQIRYEGGGVSAKAHFDCSYRILRGKTFITKPVSVVGSFVD